MNVLITGSNGYIGKSILNFKIKNVKFFEGSRQTIDLYDKKSVLHFIQKNKIDSIIHCAIEGGSRLKKDGPDVFYNNLLMFENLYYCRNLIHKLINIASGAEFDRLTDINLKKEEQIFECVPKDYYGFSKNLISKKALNCKNFYNLRIFGCFDENEKETRFIKNCILRSRRNDPLIITEDKTMDFFYLKDMLPILERILLSACELKDLNLCYKSKYKLSEIAAKIKKENKSKSEIVIENKNGMNYNGDFKKINSLQLNLKGFDKGLLETILNTK